MSEADALREMADVLAGPPPAGDDAGDRGDGAYIPLVRIERLSAAVVDRLGGVLHADGLFSDPTTGKPAMPDQADGLFRGARVGTFDWLHPSGLEMPVAFGGAMAARDWALPQAAREALDHPAAFGVLLTAGTWRAAGALEEACMAHGVTPAQSRLVAALVETGDLRLAADRTGVAYTTAKKTLAETMTRMGVQKQTALIMRLVSQTFGVLPQDARGEDLLGDLWGLTPRQAALALAVAQGASRAQAARAIGVSEASAKKLLLDVFLSLGVTSAGALSRKVADAMSLSVLARATRGDVSAAPDAQEPLAFAVRPDGGYIAFSDYGPRDGAPVLVVHTGFSSRPAPSRLVSALQRGGFRPIAIDRPGFGLTDPAPAAADHFDQAAQDAMTVARRLRIGRMDVVARGGMPFVRRLVEACPDQLGRVVMTSVPPLGGATGARASYYFMVQAILRRTPHMIRDLARLSARLFPISDIRRNIIDAVKDCPIDVAAMEDPRNFADYWRGLRMFCTGRVEGWVREQTTLAAGARFEGLEASHDWTVLSGALDSMFAPAETEAHWRALLPNARFTRLEGVGRFLVFTHPEAVTAALTQ